MCDSPACWPCLSTKRCKADATCASESLASDSGRSTMLYSVPPSAVVDAAHVADKDQAKIGIIGTMRALKDKFIRCTLGRSRTWNAARSWYCIDGPSRSKMSSSTVSMDVGIATVHRHQRFGSPGANVMSHSPPGRRQGSGRTSLAPTKIPSNERPFSMLARSDSVSRSRPPPSASSACSCERQSTSVDAPANTAR